MYTVNEKQFYSYYLGQNRLEIIEENDGAYTNIVESEEKNLRICDLMPLPFTANKLYQVSNDIAFSNYQFGFESGSEICNRDNGIYDNLPYNGWAKDTFDCKKQIFNYCNFGMSRKEKNDSYSKLFLSFVQSLMNVKISKLLVDVVDQTSETSYQLGAALILSKQSSSMTPQDQQQHQSVPGGSDDDITTIMSSTNPELDVTYDRCIVNIHIDELINIASDLKLPIHVSKSLFQKCNIDATLKNINNSANKPMMMIDGRSSAKPVAPSTAAESDVLRVWEIFDPKRFLKMSTIEKRNLLRVSGITDLPRPREGAAALSSLLTEYMDSAVREQYRSLLQSNDESSALSGYESSETSGVRVYESPRHLLLQQMAECLEKGLTEQAVALRDEFALLTQLRADPTQREGAYDRFLDQDDWYMKARRKSMK